VQKSRILHTGRFVDSTTVSTRNIEVRNASAFSLKRPDVIDIGPVDNTREAVFPAVTGIPGPNWLRRREKIARQPQMLFNH